MILPKFRRLVLLGFLVWVLAVIPAKAAEAPPALDLKEALRLAWKANPTMQISRLQSLIAGQEVVRARSGFLPTVKSEVSQTINDNEIQTKISASQFPGSSPFGGAGGGTLTFPTNNRNFWSSKTVPRPDHFRLLGHPLPLSGRGPGQIGQPPGHRQDPGRPLSQRLQGLFPHPAGPEAGGRGPTGCRRSQGPPEDRPGPIRIRGGHLQRRPPGRGLPGRRRAAPHRGQNRRHRYPLGPQQGPGHSRCRRPPC